MFAVQRRQKRRRSMQLDKLAGEAATLAWGTQLYLLLNWCQGCCVASSAEAPGKQSLTQLDKLAEEATF